MTVAEFVLVCAAVLGALAFGAATVALWVSASRLREATEKLDGATRDYREVTDTLVAQLAESADRAAGEVERVEHLLDISEGIADRLDGTTAATYRAITSPVIKGAALAEGTRRAARRLGGRPAPGGRVARRRS